MDKEIDAVIPDTAQLEQEMAACHESIMSLFKTASSRYSTEAELMSLRIATSMIRAQTGAIALLQRLKNANSRGPNEKSKTNVPSSRLDGKHASARNRP